MYRYFSSLPSHLELIPSSASSADLQLGGSVMPTSLLEYTVNVGEHIGGLLGGVDQVVDSSECVVLCQGTSLLVVRVQALLQGLHVVVAATHQRLPGDLKEFFQD